MNAQTRAVAYLRCSTTKQDESTAQQEKEIIAFAEKRGMTIIEWFVDFGISGTTFDQRPEFQRLKERVDHSANFKAVICYDESRWGRAIDSEENTYWRVHFRMKGVEVILVKTSVDPENDFAPMLLAFEGIQASQYSKKLSELTLRGCKANGIYSNGGTAPYGYVRIAINKVTGIERVLEPGQWIVSKQEKVRWGLGATDEVEIVRRIFEERKTGKGYTSIAIGLNRDKIPCPRRGRWRNKDQKWSGVTIKSILDNPTYYGARVYNRNSMSKIQAARSKRDQKHTSSYPHWRNHPSEWVTTEGAHEAIITKELWQEVQKFRNQNDGNRAPARFRSQYLFTGLIKCSKCGFAFQGWSGRADNKPYNRYVDGGHNNKGVCTRLALKKEELEAFGINAIKEVISDQGMIKKIEEELNVLFSGLPKAETDKIARLQTKIDENERGIKNLTLAIEQGAALDSMLGRIKELQGEQSKLREEIDGAQAPVNYDFARIAEEVKKFKDNFEKNFRKAPIEEQKLMVKKVISQIIVDRDSNTVKFYVRKVPAVTPFLEDFYHKKSEPTEIVSSLSSGGRT